MIIPSPAKGPDVRAAVGRLRQEGHVAQVGVTWEPGDAQRLTAEAVAQAGGGCIDCIVAGGGDKDVDDWYSSIKWVRGGAFTLDSSTNQIKCRLQLMFVN